MKKALAAVALSAALAASFSMTALAAANIGWQQSNDGRWWYCLNSNAGEWYRAQTGQILWAWIDGNNDGISECYAFDDGGWLQTNKVIEGYQVNDKGQWVVNGVVQTKSAYIRSHNSETI